MLVKTATANHQTLRSITEEPVLRNSGYRHLNESYWRAMKQVRYEPRYCIGSVPLLLLDNSQQASEEFNQMPFFSFSPKTKMRSQLLRRSPTILSISRASQSRLPVPSSHYNRRTISSLAHQHLPRWNPTIPAPCLSSLPRSHILLVGVQSVQALALAAAAALLANAV